jgi:hypothetical protein
MKTRFEIQTDVHYVEPKNDPKGLEYYKKHHEPHGFLIDNENQEVYKIFDRFIDLSEGDRVSLNGFGFGIVDWKCIYIDEGLVNYVLQHE